MSEAPAQAPNLEAMMVDQPAEGIPIITGDSIKGLTTQIRTVQLEIGALITRATMRLSCVVEIGEAKKRFRQVDKIMAYTMQRFQQMDDFLVEAKNMIQQLEQQAAANPTNAPQEPLNQLPEPGLDEILVNLLSKAIKRRENLIEKLERFRDLYLDKTAEVMSQEFWPDQTPACA